MTYLILFNLTFNLSPQVKQSAIISNKYAIYELTHELRLKTSDIRKLENVRKVYNFMEL